MTDVNSDISKVNAFIGILPDDELEKEYPTEASVNAVDAELVDARRLFTDDEAKKLRRRADLHLLPLLILCYLLKNMDSNIASVGYSIFCTTLNLGHSIWLR